MNTVERHAMACTLSMQEERAVSLRSDKRAGVTKWGGRDSAVRSSTAPRELRRRAQGTQPIAV